MVIDQKEGKNELPRHLPMLLPNHHYSIELDHIVHQEVLTNDKPNKSLVSLLLKIVRKGASLLLGFHVFRALTFVRRGLILRFLLDSLVCCLREQSWRILDFHQYLVRNRCNGDQDAAGRHPLAHLLLIRHDYSQELDSKRRVFTLKKNNSLTISGVPSYYPWLDGIQFKCQYLTLMHLNHHDH